MLKKLLSACAIVIAFAPQAYAAPNWENVGKTSTGETLSLDITSVQNKPHAGSWLFFVYRVKGSVETRQSIAKTASCSDGKLSSSKPGWIIDSTSRKVYADSVGSQNLLKRVCLYGKIANYSESNYNETDESDKALDSYNEINTQLVPGLTNSGGKLSFYSTFLHDAYMRSFSYYYIPKGQDKSQNLIQAKTHWCRNNRIEKDVRAIDQLTQIEQQVSSKPGWFVVDNNNQSLQYVNADSPASVNLLKKVCSTYAEISSPY